MRNTSPAKQERVKCEYGVSIAAWPHRVRASVCEDVYEVHVCSVYAFDFGSKINAPTYSIVVTFGSIRIRHLRY